VFNVPANTV